MPDLCSRAGDTVLKFVASTYCFVTLPDKREGALNAARSQAVSNKTLHLNALAAGIPPWILSKPMVAKLWLPGDEKSFTEEAQGDQLKQEEPIPEPKRKGKRKRQEDDRHIQWLGDKVCMLRLRASPAPLTMARPWQMLSRHSLVRLIYPVDGMQRFG